MESCNQNQFDLKVVNSKKDQSKKYCIILSEAHKSPCLIATLANIICLRQWISLGKIEHITQDDLRGILAKFISEKLNEDLEKSIKRLNILCKDQQTTSTSKSTSIDVVNDQQNEDEEVDLELFQLLKIPIYNSVEIQKKLTTQEYKSGCGCTDENACHHTIIEYQSDTIGLLIEGKEYTTAIEHRGVLYLLVTDSDRDDTIWKRYDDELNVLDVDFKQMKTPQDSDIIAKIDSIQITNDSQLIRQKDQQTRANRDQQNIDQLQQKDQQTSANRDQQNIDQLQQKDQQTRANRDQQNIDQLQQKDQQTSANREQQNINQLQQKDQQARANRDQQNIDQLQQEGFNKPDKDNQNLQNDDKHKHGSAQNTQDTTSSKDNISGAKPKKPSSSGGSSAKCELL